MTHLQHELLTASLWTAVGFAVACFVAGELTGNVSQTDKLWSIVPVIYAWIIAIGGGLPPRAVLMAALATLWGARLTYNFSRHGGYAWPPWRGAEDYRWVHVRNQPVLRSRPGWALFDLVFICLIQHALLVWIALPALDAIDAPGGIGWADIVLAVVFVALLGVEVAADQQQWRFQAEKHRRLAAGERLTGRYADGFVHDGLWRRTRHPNYLAEQSMWVVFWLFAVVATHRVDWTVGGVVLLLALFQGSANLSEGLQRDKYPAYAAYRARTPRFVPWPKAALLHRPRSMP